MHVRNRRVKPLKRSTSSNLADVGWIAVHILLPEMGSGVTPGPVEVVGREATLNACGVGVARPQGQSRAPHPSIDPTVNVGTVRMSPFPSAIQAGGGQVHRPPAASGRGGAAVVVRGRESRPHGEERQRVRSDGSGRPEVR